MASEISPVIIRRPQHCLSRKNIDPDALKVMVRLNRYGYKAFLVGGSVRDILLNKAPKDFDISTDARPGQIKKLFRNCRIIGRRFRLAHIIFRGNKIIEVSTFRRRPAEIQNEDNGRTEKTRKGDNTFGEPHEDALRRDLSINGLFYDISTFSILDYVGGIDDLKSEIIRTIGDPEERFCEDSLRMVRAVRHAVRTDFNIEPETCAAIVRCATLLKDCNASRLQDEFQKDLEGGFFCPILRRQHELGLLKAYYKELDKYLGLSKINSDLLFQQQWIWTALAELDSPMGKDVLRKEFRLASFLFPLMEQRFSASFPWLPDSLAKGADIHAGLIACCAPVGISRRDREQLKMLWTGWLRLLRFLSIKRIPVRFQKKPYFKDVLQWHRFYSFVKGEPETVTRNTIQQGIRAGCASVKRRKRKPKENG